MRMESEKTRIDDLEGQIRVLLWVTAVQLAVVLVTLVIVLVIAFRI